MPLNSKDPESEGLATQPNAKTVPSAEDPIDRLLARVRTEFPNGDFGRRITKEEEEEILGYGPDGF